MNFKLVNKKIKEQFKRICSTGKLFRSNIPGVKIWDIYYSSFKVKNKFRDPNSSEHNCNCCKNFIRRYGNIVSINEEGNLESIFSNIEDVGEYLPSIKACAKILENSQIQNVFFETYKELNENLNYESCKKTQDFYKLGIESNFKQYTTEEAGNFPGTVDTDKIYEFNHFQLDLPRQFVKFTNGSIEHITAIYRDKYQVFKRAMEEIPLDTLNLVKDLINQGSLLDGTAHLHAVEFIISEKSKFQLCSKSDTINNWLWQSAYSMEERTAKFKNTLIGVLCTELAEGMELNKACLNWNKRVDPVNYNKAKAPITEAQRKLAEKFVIENGYLESFNRRLATINDIKASEILHKNSDNAKAKAVTIFDNIKTPSGVGRHKRSEFDKLIEIPIEKFMEEILPGTTVELLMENKFEGNLVNLTTTVNKDAKQLFKWNNPFSYTFNGGLAGKSQLAQMVEAKGGRTDGAFRFTHSWNELEPNQSLMDLHVFMPNSEPNPDNVFTHTYNSIGRRVGWNLRKDTLSGGIQDVDYTERAPEGYVPVENITFPELSKMPEGKYICKVHNWDFRRTGGRGKAELAFEGNIYQYEYPVTKNNQWITVAEIILKDGKFTIEHKLPEVNSSKNLWGVSTQEFHKVNLVCLTPNHWGTNVEEPDEDTFTNRDGFFDKDSYKTALDVYENRNKGIGNKHYLFMLQGCKNPNSVRGFHNEHLTSDLLKHRKVLDVLGNSAMIEPTDNQLAGVGFNATVREEVILRLSGSHKRIVKVKF